MPQPPVKKDILDNKVTITLSQTSYVYDGRAKKPAITVKDGDKVLTEGTDYTVVYQNNKNVGTAKVIIVNKEKLYKGIILCYDGIK